MLRGRLATVIAEVDSETLRLYQFHPRVTPSESSTPGRLRRVEQLQRSLLGGRLRGAEALARDVAAKAGDDPFAGCLAGYMLLRLGCHQEELGELASAIIAAAPQLSDAFILHGEYEAYRQNREAADQAFADAAAAEVRPWEDYWPGGEAPFPFWSNFDVRPVRPNPDGWTHAGDPRFLTWVRLRTSSSTDDPVIDAVRMLAVADSTMFPAATLAHEGGFPYLAPSLDLTLSFHRLGGSSEWLLVDGRSPLADGAIVAGEASLWSSDGHCSRPRGSRCSSGTRLRLSPPRKKFPMIWR
jgi:acyl-CoA thioesterase